MAVGTGFAGTIKLGKVGSELTISSPSTFHYLSAPFSQSAGNDQAEVQNTIREHYTVLHRRLAREYQIQCAGADEAMFWKLDSMNALPAQELAFIFADNWPIYSEEYTLETTTTFTMKSNPHLRLDKAYNDIAGAAQIDVLGVFAGYAVDGSQATTNYFSSFNRATWVVTLSPSPGAIGTKVYVNWTYKGALVKVRPPGFRAIHQARFRPSTGAPMWALSATLVGV